MSKRVVRVISYEGNPDWVDQVLRQAHPRRGTTTFTSKGTIKCLQQVELGTDEFITVATVKYGAKDVSGL